MSLDIDLVSTVDTGGSGPYEITLASQNITHNVSRMWREAGCYDALYESHGKTAGETLPALRAALVDMKANPAKYEALDAPNGWGKYKHALPWLEEWLGHCERHPKAIIEVSK